MSETIPSDIRAAAMEIGVDWYGVDEWKASGLARVIARALLAERERCAKIAVIQAHETAEKTRSASPFLRGSGEPVAVVISARASGCEDAGRVIYNAIRSDHTASMEAAAPGYLSRRRAIKEGE